jgi:hypothetical protein
MKNNGLYYEKLNWFKEHEKPEVLLTVADNSKAIKAIIAWTNTNTRPANRIGILRGNSENEIWTWLWENTEYSNKEMLDKLDTSLSEEGLKARLKTLIGNRVIYPDGTINSYVQKYLREQVVKLFKENKKVKIQTENQFKSSTYRPVLPTISTQSHRRGHPDEIGISPTINQTGLK